MFVVKVVDLMKGTVTDWDVTEMQTVDDLFYLVEGSGSCDCNRHSRINPAEETVPCNNSRYIIVDYNSDFPILEEDFPAGNVEGYRLSRSGLIKAMNDDYSDDDFVKGMQIYETYKETEVQKLMGRRNLIAIDKGALQMAINVLTRNGKHEQVTALRESCVDIEDNLIPWYVKHHPGIIDVHKEKES
jgi:hypothetical protein